MGVNGGSLGVLFVIYGLAPAGPELRLLEFARAFPSVTAPIDTHICVVGDDLTLLDEFRHTPAHVIHIPMARPYLEWGNLQKVFEYVEAHGIRVINSFNLKTLLVGAAARLRFGGRVKLVHHLISLWDDVTPRQRRATWMAMRCADRVLCNGHAVRDGVIGTRVLAAPVSVIPNGVDCDRFRPDAGLRAAERSRLGFTDQHFVVGTVGNARPVKNYPFLLRAMRTLVTTWPDARLLVVGGGPQLEETKSLAQSLGLSAHVRFTGQVKDVWPLFTAMDAFGLTSSHEGNPNVVLQAMAAAVPVVSVTVGEVPAIVEQGRSGLLVAQGDLAGFAGSLAQLAGDPSRRAALGTEGRRRVQASHSSSQMIASYAALMRQAAGGPLPTSSEPIASHQNRR
jgi:glycosyltransferase involved in cell wall biosynthesis